MLHFRSIPPPAQAFTRVAYATDCSPATESGLTRAIQLVKDYNAELLLLHVLDPPTPIFEAHSPMKPEAELALSALLTRLEKMEIRARALLLTGTTSIDIQILRAAIAEQTDLIIVGAPRRTGLARFMPGNVAARLIARSHCPVLVVPAEQQCKKPIYRR